MKAIFLPLKIPSPPFASSNSCGLG